MVRLDGDRTGKSDQCRDAIGSDSSNDARAPWSWATSLSNRDQKSHFAHRDRGRRIFENEVAVFRSARFSRMRSFTGGPGSDVDFLATTRPEEIRETRLRAVGMLIIRLAKNESLVDARILSRILFGPLLRASVLTKTAHSSRVRRLRFGLFRRTV